MSDITLLFLIIAAVIVLFVTEKVPVVVVALATALALYSTGVLDLGQALGGFGDPAVIFIASLFVVSAGLEATGVTAWAGQFLIAKAGESRARLLDADHAAGGAADRADQPQRRGRGAAAGRRGDGGAPRAAAVPAADAAGVRRPCRLDAGADRHAGERAGLGAVVEPASAAFGFFEFALPACRC